MALLDVDRLPEAMAVSRLTSYNRFNWASFHDADHYRGSVRCGCATAWRGARPVTGSRAARSGPIYLLTHLRYAGYVFNPISIYYCYDQHGALTLVLADVRNTYGGRREYWLRPTDALPHRFKAAAAKSLYVSPFMTHDVGYEFVLTPPAAALVAHMNVAPEGGGKVFDATLTLERRPWTAAEIRRALCGFPVMTAKVIARHPLAGAPALAQGCAGRPFRKGNAIDDRPGGRTLVRTRRAVSARGRSASASSSSSCQAARRAYGCAGDRTVGDVVCRVNRRFFRRAALGGEIGLGDSYMDGDWTTPDLVALVRLMLANQHALSASTRLRDLGAAVTRGAGASPARQHARWQPPQHPRPLRPRQRVLPAVPRRQPALLLRGSSRIPPIPWRRRRSINSGQSATNSDSARGDHVLEIGTGWGGFALFAATRYGCRVTTTTISAEQHAYAGDLFARAGSAGQRIDLRFEDYRDLRGRYDAIVSIEMFEAVGLDHYDDYFAACERLLARRRRDAAADNHRRRLALP